jgi:hypothetical protein
MRRVVHAPTVVTRLPTAPPRESDFDGATAGERAAADLAVRVAVVVEDAVRSVSDDPEDFTSGQ